jgi:hypothetical protein
MVYTSEDLKWFKPIKKYMAFTYKIKAMFSLFIKNTFITIIISIIIITLLHYFWEYIKDTYSTRKVKDLVNTQIEKYKEIAASTISDNDFIKNNDREANKNYVLTEEEKVSMQEDLEAFIKDNKIE